MDPILHFIPLAVNLVLSGPQETPNLSNHDAQRRGGNTEKSSL